MTKPVNILGVDDEADFEALIRQRFRRQIREGEFTFRFAHHGEEALAALAAEPDIELMLLDINMPVMDGLTLLNELRERQSDVRAIIVSAYGDMAIAPAYPVGRKYFVRSFMPPDDRRDAGRQARAPG